MASKKIMVLKPARCSGISDLDKELVLKSMHDDIEKYGICMIPNGYEYKIEELDDVQDKHEEYLKKNSGIKNLVVIDGKEVANAVSKYTTVDKRKY